MGENELVFTKGEGSIFLYQSCSSFRERMFQVRIIREGYKKLLLGLYSKEITGFVLVSIFLERKFLKVWQDIFVISR